MASRKKAKVKKSAPAKRAAPKRGSVRAAKRINISSGGAYEPVFGYSRAVAFGDTIHVSGTCAPAGNEAADAYGQSKAALALIEQALKQAGASLAEVVRTVVYVSDMNDADQIAKAHREAFGSVMPASTMVQIVRMLRDWHRVEIEAYAIKGAKA
jgi:enamine deaminase RidA (YjgF/YER057c/UK114 family)